MITFFSLSYILKSNHTSQFSVISYQLSQLSVLNFQLSPLNYFVFLNQCLEEWV